MDESPGRSGDKYGLSQSDFYQLYAYGQRYLGGNGTLLLVYPKTATFKAPLDEFAFDGQLKLAAVPFDLFMSAGVETGSAGAQISGHALPKRPVTA